MRQNASRVHLIVLCLFICFGLLACQPKQETYTVGVLNYVPALKPAFDGFKERMGELGYEEETDIVYVYKEAQGGIAELPDMARDLVANEVDLILTLSTPATLEAKKATAENPIPIIFAPATDPKGTGIVEKPSEPEGNITGVTNFGSELRRLEWLLNLSPEGTDQIYVPYNPDDPSAKASFKTAQEAADQLGVKLWPQEATNVDEMRTAIENIPTEAEAIFMLPDGLAINLIKEFVAAADEHDLPFAVPTTFQVENGALMSFGIDLVQVGRQAARLADQILRGVSPSDLPVETGEFFLAINLKAAEEINLSIPDEILNQASIICRPDPSQPTGVDCR